MLVSARVRDGSPSGGETEGLDAKHESAVPQADAQTEGE
jgi:hypothetical protein